MCLFSLQYLYEIFKLGYSSDLGKKYANIINNLSDNTEKSVWRKKKELEQYNQET